MTFDRYNAFIHFTDQAKEFDLIFSAMPNLAKAMSATDEFIHLRNSLMPTKLIKPETWLERMESNRVNLIQQLTQVWSGYASATMTIDSQQFYDAFPPNKWYCGFLAERRVRSVNSQSDEGTVVLHFDSDEDAIHFKLKHL